MRGVEAARALRLQETVKPRARVDRGTILSRVTDRAHQLDLCRGFGGKKIFRIVPPRLLGKPGEALFTNALRLKSLEFANWFHVSKIGDRQRAVFGRKPLRGRTRARRTGNHEIDPNGNYVDPLYGKIEFTNLISAHSYTGDVLPFQIQRQGKPMELKVTLEHRDAIDYVSPPYALDEVPKYLVLGGLIFQELSRQYLKEWGPNWQREAPQRFVYLDRFQSELFPGEHRRIVILSQVLPANNTIGYDEFSYLTVTKVNGQEIKSLNDLAAAIKQPIEGGFIKIETEEDPKQIELEASQVAAEAQDLQENYGISSLQRLE